MKMDCIWNYKIDISYKEAWHTKQFWLKTLGTLRIFIFQSPYLLLQFGKA